MSESSSGFFFFFLSLHVCTCRSVSVGLSALGRSGFLPQESSGLMVVGGGEEKWCLNTRSTLVIIQDSFQGRQRCVLDVTAMHLGLDVLISHVFRYTGDTAQIF